ncbi:conserved hypothetical protein [Ricinus communis]|uniref:RNase H type-1 domain-containing protein n=1 Tax=Ricinus communis TaxID=3988 RepID=B9RNK7_RICCO|nr:conserved hypothetical protein [Ricinus communis]
MNARNAIVFEQQWKSEQDIITLMIKEMKEYKDVTFETVQFSPKAAEVSSFCHLQQKDWIRINFDAASRPGLARGSVGFVARNGCDQILSSMAKAYVGILDPLVLESLALRDSMEWALESAWNKVFFEGDSLAIVQMVNKNSSFRASVMMIIQEIFSSLPSFSNVRVSYCPRACNILTHNEAKSVFSSPQ